MSPELVMYLCQMNALVALIESMKVDNAACAARGDGPKWSSDHFDGIANDLQRLSSCAGSLSS